MIHDFGGFPDELYKIVYPAPGEPGIAAHALALLKSAGFTAGIDGCRGMDHGTWVPLLKMYPDADVPVVQLSVQTGDEPAASLRSGARAGAPDKRRRADRRLRAPHPQSARLDDVARAEGHAHRMR